MGICPKCNNKIRYLIETCSGYRKVEVFFNKEKNWVDWRNEDFDSDGVFLEYRCPECDHEFKEEEYEDFLKNDDGIGGAIAEVLNGTKDN